MKCVHDSEYATLALHVSISTLSVLLHNELPVDENTCIAPPFNQVAGCDPVSSEKAACDLPGCASRPGGNETT